MVRRAGISLVEVLVTVAVLAVFIGLLLPAIQNAREAAARAQSVNNLKQITLGLHQLAGVSDGFIGGVIKADPATWQERDALNNRPVRQGPPLHYIIRVIDATPDGQRTNGIKSYLLSPGDPSWQGQHRTAVMPGPDDVVITECAWGGPTSYAFNMAAFAGPARFPASITDGTSQTIAFSERYYERCADPEPIETINGPLYRLSWLAYASNEPALADILPNVLNNLGERRPSFADAGWGDVVPVTTGDPPVTRPSRPGATFQVRPPVRYADPALPQTPFPAGLPVALFDGSVRTIRPGVRPEAFWGMVTPAAGEVLADD